MNVLFAVSECVPFVKSGGLADVAGALPKELMKQGINVQVMLPNYGSIPAKYKEQFEFVTSFTVDVGWRKQYCGIFSTVFEGITYYFVDNEYYFKRDSFYGHYDDGERFGFFGRAVLDSLSHLDIRPDIIHCHDWHTAIIPFLLRNEYNHCPIYKDIKSVFTIHNLQFQGIFPKSVMNDILNLPDTYFTIDALEFYGNINFMKGGIVASDAITAVSPTYKQEIQYPFFGERLDGLLRKYEYKLKGIINGIDHVVYNPATDDSIHTKYDIETIEKKMENKLALQRRVGLCEDVNVPIIAMVTRLTRQKGLDLVRHVFHEIMKEDVQFVLLGTGDREYENFFHEMDYQYPNKVKATIGFNEEMAHQIYAGADLFLMPSLFEPCGLGQLIALQYGTLPIVRETGGLNDTVQSYDEVNQTGNGFSFKNFNAHDMLYTIRRALHMYGEKEKWNAIVKEAMKRDYSWANSAREYARLYRTL
ncbi:MAG: glycogen synthase GlgA [Bacillaceae bacterium]